MSRVNPAPFDPTTLTASSSEGSQAIAAGASWVPPAGSYMVVDTTGQTFQKMYVAAAWKGLGVLTLKTPYCLISDGANMQIYNSDTVSQTVYWRKF